jgi:hypothetical protein
MNYFNMVLNKVRSYYLIIDLLETQNISKTVFDKFEALRIKRSENLINFKKNTLLWQNDIAPLFAHEHFKMIRLLSNSEVPSLQQFVNFFILNASNYN